MFTLLTLYVLQVEFDDVMFATQALQDMYGHTLGGLIKGGIRLSYSKVSLSHPLSPSTIPDFCPTESAWRPEQRRRAERVASPAALGRHLLLAADAPPAVRVRLWPRRPAVLDGLPAVDPALAPGGAVPAVLPRPDDLRAVLVRPLSRRARIACSYLA